MLGEIISGAFGIGSGVGSYLGSKYAADKQYQIWHEQRDWNTPAAQMQRYKEAGLNPNLIYGSVDSGNMSNPPVMPNMGEAIGNGISRGLETYLQVRNMKAQLRKADAEADSAEATTANINADTAIKQAEAVAKTNSNNEYSLFGLSSAYMRLQNLRQDYYNKIKSGHLTSAQESKMRKEIDMLDIASRKMKKEIELLDKNIDKAGLDYTLLESTIPDLIRQERNKATLSATDVYSREFWNRKGLGPFPDKVNVFNAAPYLIYGLLSQAYEWFGSKR